MARKLPPDAAGSFEEPSPHAVLLSEIQALLFSLPDEPSEPPPSESDPDPEPDNGTSKQSNS